MRTEFGMGCGLGGPKHHGLQDWQLLRKLHTVTEGQGSQMLMWKAKHVMDQNSLCKIISVAV